MIYTLINIIIAIAYVHKSISGTYGTVFKAKNKETQEIVALKRVRLDDDDEVIRFLSYQYFWEYYNIVYNMILFHQIILYHISGCTFVSIKRNMFTKRTETSEYCTTT